MYIWIHLSYIYTRIFGFQLTVERLVSDSSFIRIFFFYSSN